MTGDATVGLNDEQREAAHHGDGPLLVIAGAGTGKTQTLVHRVAHLIQSGVDPRRILLLTFTRRAASEMLRRVDGLLRQLGRLASDAGTPEKYDPRVLALLSPIGGLQSGRATNGRTVFTNGIDTVRLTTQDSPESPNQSDGRTGDSDLGQSGDRALAA